MVELVDTLDLGSSAEKHESSSLSIRTKQKIEEIKMKNLNLLTLLLLLK